MNNEESLKNLKIGIIGVGMVGKTLEKYFKRQGIKLFLYDKYKKLGSVKEINQAEIIFICVPTPFDKKKNYFDLSCVEDALSKIRGKKIIVIKSTLLPGTTQKLQNKHPQHKFLFNPEFLSEATADEDFQNPDRQIIGYTEKSKDIAKDVLAVLPRAPYEKIMPASEAEMVKYFNNTFNAVKVIFANQIYDLCQALNLNYDNIMEIAAKSKFILTDSHLHIWHKGYRGYGGKCLPKDMKSLIRFAESLGVELKLHKVIDEINDRLLKEQGIEDSEKLSKRES